MPIRLELGRKDIEASEVRCAKRHDGSKIQLKFENLAGQITGMLDQIHHEMYDKALKARLEHVKEVDNWADFMEALNKRNICLTPWCNVQKCEVTAKDRSKEESLKAMAE